MRSNLITVVLLVVAGVAGAVCNFSILPWLVQNLFRDVFAAPGLSPLQEFLNEGPPTLFKVFWFCTLGAVAAWFGRTVGRRAASAARVAEMRDRWWTTASLLLVVGLVCMAFSIWIPFPQVPLAGSILLVGLLLVDEALFFWLPTVLTSPRSYRLVVPGAQLVRSLKGG